MAIRTYRDLDVFRESYAAALDVSRLCKSFPAFEQYELAKQLRRAARSIRRILSKGGENEPLRRNSRDIYKSRSARATKPECGWI